MLGMRGRGCGCVFSDVGGFLFSLSLFLLFFFVRPRVSWGFFFFYREYCFYFKHLSIDSNL